MANSLKMDITNKYVLIKTDCLKEEFHEIPKRVFFADGCFGTKPYTMGRSLGGEFVFDGERATLDGYDVERLATDEEIASAKKLRK